MSSPCPDERAAGEGGALSRRAWLKRTALTGGAALAASVFAAPVFVAPALARAGCPCGDEGDAGKDASPPPATQPATVLKVCGDPDNLPFSNRAGEGFEDKVAALIARDLGMELGHQWLPQRLGFFREAFKSGDANLVMAVPAGFERSLTTIPYYRSTYVFVCRKESGPRVASFDDPALRTAKIGVPLTGGDNTPPTHALARRKLIDNVTGFPVFDETEGRPGEKLIAAVASGEIDVAVAWGPPAGYFARRQRVPLEVVPVLPREEPQGEASMPYTFDICVGVRRPQKELRDRVNEVLTRRRREIDAILDDFGVPRLPVRPAAKHEDH